MCVSSILYLVFGIFCSLAASWEASSKIFKAVRASPLASLAISSRLSGVIFIGWEPRPRSVSVRA